MRCGIIISALCMQLCLGATYSWSIFVAPIRTLTGISQAHAQLPFSVFYFVFPATMIFSGTLLKKTGPRIAAMTGGVLFGGGWLLSSLGDDHFLYTIVGNGLIAGIGAGIAYIVPISTCMKWFPRNKGLVTGIAVAGFGGGAALVSVVSGKLIAGGDTPFQLFGQIGLAFTAIIVLAGLIMRDPPAAAVPDSGRDTPVKILADRRFYLLYFAMFAGLSAGFAVNANIRELLPASRVIHGTGAVAVFAIANAAGRVAWGSLFDRYASVPVLQANLVTQVVVLLSAPLILISPAGLFLFSGLCGFNYGGVLVIYAGSVARIWGADNVGTIYGWLFSANIPGAIAPLFAGFCYDIFQNFRLPMTIISVILLAATFLIQKQKTYLSPHWQQKPPTHGIS